MLRKLVAILVLLVLGMVVGSAGAAVIKTNINFVGPGTVSNKMIATNGKDIVASEGTVVSSPYMIYSQVSTKDLSDLTSSNILKVSSSDAIKFDSGIYMSKYFASTCRIDAVNGSLTYVTTSNHATDNYTRDILLSAEKVSSIIDLEHSNIAGHDFSVKGTIYGVYFNSSTSMLNVSGNESITGSTYFNVPSYNVSGVPSFDGTLLDTLQVPMTADISITSNVTSFSVNNTYSITRPINIVTHTISQNVNISGIFDTNVTPPFFSEYIHFTVPATIFP